MSDPEHVNFGVAIRQARKKLGWSQEQLAQKAGVSRPTVARVETGNDVTTTTIIKLARALGLTLELK